MTASCQTLYRPFGSWQTLFTSKTFMYDTSLSNRIETDFGLAIFSDLIGEPLKRNGQPVRLFDQSKHTSESFFKADRNGKPYIQNWQTNKRTYPITAYREQYGVDYATAIKDLSQQYGLSNERTTTRPRVERPAPAPVVVDLIPLELYAPCRGRYEQNGLWLYLRSFLGEDVAQSTFERYRLGTSLHWRFAGTLATTLPQFDTEGNIRQIKIMPFHPITGKRAKKDQPSEIWNKTAKCYEPDAKDKVWFAGKSILKNKEADLTQCYFGEHLLALFPDSPVALVEGESTALLMAVLWPQYIWLATGGCNGGKWDAPERFDVLRGRKVTLFPDSGKWNDWDEKAAALHGIAAELTVSRHVEDKAPKANLDLRDLIELAMAAPITAAPTAISEQKPAIPAVAEDQPAEVAQRCAENPALFIQVVAPFVAPKSVKPSPAWLLAWTMWPRPPLAPPAFDLSAFIEPIPVEPAPVIVATIADQLANPGSILRPAESQVERLVVAPVEGYPPDWDMPALPGAVPNIRALNFEEWQRRNDCYGAYGFATSQEISAYLSREQAHDNT